MNSIKFKLVVVLLTLISSSAFAQYSECSSECLVIDSGAEFLMDYGPVEGYGRDPVAAFQQMDQDCKTLVYNADPCGNPNSTGSVLVKSTDLYQHTSSGWDRIVNSAGALGLAVGNSGFAFSEAIAASSTESSYSNSEYRIRLEYARAADPQVCQMQRGLPHSAPRPVRIPPPYCGTGQPLG